MIQEAIKKISKKENLSRDEAEIVFDEIMNGETKLEEIVELLLALNEKGETIEEIQGAAESMRKVVSEVKHNATNVLDVVGTGGDGKNSFNVSTTSAIVAAGAGCIVAKHGNKSVSSNSGAADVLKELGVNIETNAEKNARILAKIGFCFMFAQMHHPAMKYAAGPRKEIGKRTIFNILGPITNPAKANTYLLGAYSEELAEKLANVLAGLDTKHALVVYGQGYDEASLIGKTVYFEIEKGIVERKEITPEEAGLPSCSEEDLKVSGPEESAKIILAILKGKDRGAKRNTILLNAGMAIYANKKAKTILDGIEKAKESIDSGNALKKLNELIEATNETEATK